MRNCPRCGLDGDCESFFPEESNQKWCRLCVEEFVSSRHKDRTDLLQKKEREQKAVRDLVSQLQPNNEPMVYLIQGTGGYKIGYSQNIAKRACQLNTAFSETCTIVAITSGDRTLERRLHHKHRFKRLNREWFAQSPTILNDFKKLEGTYVFLKGHMESSPFAQQHLAQQ